MVIPLTCHEDSHQAPSLLETAPMRFSLIPREMRFFDMFEEVAATIHRAAVKFLDMVTIFDNLSVRAQEIKQEEGQ